MQCHVALSSVDIVPFKGGVYHLHSVIFNEIVLSFYRNEKRYTIKTGCKTGHRSSVFVDDLKVCTK